ncbi:unnamed protein product [Schistosoma margrebowiei]|uniref:Uncharacterized protein n=1 Tax=Schistosoma margrebowiei TaxID=48269 RepID=A0A183LUJ0_9TREM|nr:unnamed protein product [Schistosoma margrebowiei]
MEILDQDFGLLKVGQEQACRDNVQFVQMRRFLRLAADGSDSIRWSKVALAKEVLAELPSQILEYLDKNHLSPQHLVPRQAEKLSDLTNPDWWRRFTQPLCENQMNPISNLSEDENDAFQRLQLIDKNNPSTISSNSPISSTSSDQYYCKSGQIFNLSDNDNNNNNNSTLNEMKSYSMNQSSPKKSIIPLYRQMSLGTTKLTENYPIKTRFRRLPSGADTNRISSARSNNNTTGFLFLHTITPTTPTTTTTTITATTTTTITTSTTTTSTTNDTSNDDDRDKEEEESLLKMTT